MEKAQPILSILVPTVNPGPRVERIIEELLDYKSSDFELVLSLNAPDQSLLINDKYKSDKRLILNREIERLNVAENWTRAVHVSSGKYIWLIGDDDFITSKQLDNILANIRVKDIGCFSFNGSSFIFPSKLSNQRALARPRHFSYEKSVLGVLDDSKRERIITNMFRFKPLIPLNMQLTIFSRKIFEDLGNQFKMPFPDHIALMEMLALKQKWEIVDSRFCIVGMANSSFGNSAYTNSDSIGESYLGMSKVLDNQIPGNVLNSVMHSWLQNLASENPAFSNRRVSQGDYLLRQIGVGYRQLTSSIIDKKTLFKRISQLSFLDWVKVFSALARADNLRSIVMILKRKPGIDRIIGSKFEIVQTESISEFAKDPVNSEI